MFVTCKGDAVGIKNLVQDDLPFVDFYERAVDDNSWRGGEHGHVFRHLPTCHDCLRTMRIVPTKLMNKYFEKGSSCSFAKYRKAVQPNPEGTTMVRILFHSPTSYEEGALKHEAHALWTRYQSDRGGTHRPFDFHTVPWNANEFRNDDVVSAMNGLWKNRGDLWLPQGKRDHDHLIDDHHYTRQKLRGTVVAHFYIDSPQGEKLIAICSYDLMSKYVCAKTFVFDPHVHLPVHRPPGLGNLCFFLGLDLTLLLQRTYVCVGPHSPCLKALQWKDKLIDAYPDCVELLGVRGSETSDTSESSERFERFEQPKHSVSSERFESSSTSSSPRPFEWQSAQIVRQRLLSRV